MEYQKLFDHMVNEHALTLFQSEMQEIIDIVREIDGDGWIRIESEEDLPKNTRFQEFHVYAHDGVFIDNENIGIDSWWSNDEDKKTDWLSSYTHYQPIQKPEPPKH